MTEESDKPSMARTREARQMVSGIRQVYSRRVTGYSRLFVVAIAANILLALGILWVLIATLCPLRP